MDILARNVKTGEVKTLPVRVFEAAKKYWVPIEEEDESIDLGPADSAPATTQIQREDIITTAQINQVIESELKESLPAIYERLTGKKPDGRWSEGKLTQKIEELKGQPINERN
jgi:hypothetical protein